MTQSSKTGSSLLPSIGLGLVCLAAALWATVGVASQLTTEVASVHPAITGLARTALGAACLLAIARIVGVRSPAERVPFRALAVFGIAGAVFQVSLFEAFELVGVTITVAVTVCAPPLIVALGDAVWHRRPPEARVLAAIAVGTAGILLLLAGTPGRAEPQIDPRGAIHIAAASLAFAVLAATTRFIAASLHPVRAAGLGLASTAAVLGGVVALSDPAGAVVLVRLDWSALAILAYVGIAATGGAYLAFTLGMKLCRSSSAGLAATMVEPVIAAVLATIVLDEHLNGPATAGCVLTLVALHLLFRTQVRGA